MDLASRKQVSAIYWHLAQHEVPYVEGIKEWLNESLTFDDASIIVGHMMEGVFEEGLKELHRLAPQYF